MSTDLKLSKAQISRIIQSGEFLRLLLSKIAGPLMKVADLLAENILAPLGITTAASAIDVGTQKKIYSSARPSSSASSATTLIISNKEMNYIIKIVQALGDCIVLLKGVTKTIKKETKERNGGFLSMLFGTLAALLLGNLLAGKGIVRAGSGNKKEKEILRDGYGKEWDF